MFDPRYRALDFYLEENRTDMGLTIKFGINIHQLFYTQDF